MVYQEDGDPGLHGQGGELIPTGCPLTSSYPLKHLSLCPQINVKFKSLGISNALVVCKTLFHIPKVIM